MSNILVYGDDIDNPDLMRAQAEKLRSADHKVGLRSAVKFFGDTEKCDAVVILGNYPKVRDAYAALNIKVVEGEDKKVSATKSVYADLKVDELRAKCAERGIAAPDGAKKKDLIELLEAADKA